ncbi:MAG: replication-associated recombination protein A [Oscillospiraceae bacterium]|nr:replication-associated recombination protein A [Oscillospiraceae bacterium]
MSGGAAGRREPLAYRMSPKTIEDFVGQEDVVGKGKLLYRMIKSDRITSIILFGPPGTGKTSLARIIANTTRSHFEKLNAVTSGVADIKRVIAETENSMFNQSGRTVLFIDEIHRFNKAQQDALLPSVENGAIVLIGATTENPFFEVNKALISRSSVFMLKPLAAGDIRRVLESALSSPDGLGGESIRIDDEAVEYLAMISDGDARRALNALELAFLTSDMDAEGQVVIDLEAARNSVQKRSHVFDKKGDAHYDNISAFIKSMRGSDPDAAVFYLARAIASGEDPMFLARRIVICAAEDVGLANPNALLLASAAAQAVHLVGLPEAQLILSEAALYIATCPKSNSACVAIGRAMGDVESMPTGEPPMHLRNAVTDGMANLGYGKGYLYAHNYENNYVPLQFLPDEVKDRTYYVPGDNRHEKQLADYLAKIKSAAKQTDSNATTQTNNDTAAQSG